jgi:Tol biopolymer transport system component
MQAHRDDAGNVRELFTVENIHAIFSLSPDGRYLVYAYKKDAEAGNMDLAYVMLGDEHEASEPRDLRFSNRDELFPSISPDGLLFAYSEGNPNQMEIFLSRLPTGEERWQTFVAGIPIGWEAGRDQYWLYYRDETNVGGQVSRVSVRIDENKKRPTVGAPETLFDWREMGLTRIHGMTPDGSRFLSTKSILRDENDESLFVMERNWEQMFK